MVWRRIKIAVSVCLLLFFVWLGWWGYAHHLRPYLFTRLRKEAMQLADDSFQGKVKVQIGKIDGELTRGIVISHIVLKEKQSKKVLASVDRVKVRYALGALWRYRHQPLKALDKIEIKKAYVRVERDKNGKWNWQKVVPPQKKKPGPPQAMLFRWKAEKVKVDFEDRSLPMKVKERFTVNASGDFHFFPIAFFKAEVERKGARVSVSAQIDTHTRKVIALAQAKAELKPFLHYLPEKLPFTVKEGEAAVTSFVSTDADFASPLQIGYLKVDGLKIVEPRAGEITVRAEGVSYEDMVHLLGLEAKGPGKQVEATGWLLDYKKPFFIVEGRGKVNLSSLQALLPRREHLAGAIQLFFSGGGQIDDPAFHLEAQGKARSRGVTATNIRTAVDYAKRKAFIASSLSVAGGQVQAKGVVGLNGKHPKGSFVVKGDKLSLSALPLPQEPKIEGKANGIVWIGFASPLQVFGGVQLDRVAFQKEKLKGGIDQASGTFFYKGDKAELLGLYAKKAESELFADASIELPKQEMVVSVDGFHLQPDLAPLSQPLPVKDWDVPLFLHGEVTGNFSHPVIKGKGFIGTSSFTLVRQEKGKERITPFAWEGADLSVSGTPKDLVWQTFLFEDGGKVSVEGKVKPVDQWIDVKVEGKNLAIGDTLDRILGEEKDMDLEVQLDGEVKGNWTNPTGKVQLALSPFVKAGEPLLDGGELHLNLKDKAIQFTHSQVRHKGQPLNIRGGVELKKGGQIDLSVEGKSWDLSGFVQGGTEATGKIDLLAKILGTIDHHTLTFSATSPMLKMDNNILQGFALNASLKNMPSGEAESSSPIPHYKGSFSEEGRVANGKVLTKGSLETGTQDAPIHLEGTTTWSGIQIEKLLENLGKENISGKGEGRVDFAVDFKPNPPKSDFYPYPSLKGEFSFSDGKIAGQPYLALQSNFAYKDNVYSLSPFFFRTPSGQLSVEGVFNPQGDVNMKIVADKIQLALLKELPLPVLQTALEGGNPKGEASINVMLRGNVNQPQMLGVIKANDVQLGKERLDEFVASWTYRDDRIKISRIFAKNGEESVLVKGELPFVWKSKQLAIDKPVNLSLNIPKFSLNRLSDFLPAIIEGEGEIGGELHLTGTLSQPAWQGSLHLQGNSFRFKDTGTELDSVTADLLADKETFSIKNFEAKLGGGILKASGQATLKSVVKGNTLAGFSPAQLNLKAWTEKDIKLILPPSLQGMIGMDLRFTGDEKGTKLSGVVRSRDTNFILVPSEKEEATSEISPFLKNLHFDLAFQVGDNFWVKNDKLRLLMDTDAEEGMRFRGTLEHPDISNALVSKRGEMTLYSRSFNITESAVFFTPVHGLEPNIFARAETTVQDNGNDVPIEIVVDGVASKMDISISSSKEGYLDKSKGELLALLIGKQGLEEDPTKTLQNEAKSLAANYGKMLVLEEIERKVEEALGLKEFRVEFSESGGYAISVKEEVYPKLIVRYKRVLGETISEEMGLDYEILGFTRGVNPLRLVIDPTRSIFARLFPHIQDLSYSLTFNLKRQQSASPETTGGLKSEFNF